MNSKTSRPVGIFLNHRFLNGRDFFPKSPDIAHSGFKLIAIGFDDVCCFARLDRMQNRKELFQEYFEIKIYIDKGNRLASEKTELLFLACRPLGTPNIALIVKTTSKTNSNFVLLCEYRPGLKWMSVQGSQFPVLKDFCTQELNRCLNKDFQKTFSEQIGIQLGQDLARKLGAL